MVTRTPASHSSPAELILGCYSKAVGFRRLFDSIYPEIDGGTAEAKRDAMSLLLLATTFELMHLSPYVGVSWDRFVQVYARIAAEFPKAPQDTIECDPLVAVEAGRQFHLGRDDTGQVVLLNGGDADDLSKNLKQLRLSCRKALLTQLTVLYRLQSLGFPYNVNSLLAQDAMDIYFSDRMLEQLRDIAVELAVAAKSERNIGVGGSPALEELLNLLFGLAYNLAAHPEVTSERGTAFWRILADAAGPDLTGIFEVALFQAAYHHYRRLRTTSQEEDVWSGIDGHHCLIQLGCLEAIASGHDPPIPPPEMRDSTAANFRKIEEDLVEEITAALSEAPVRDRHTAVSVMAYDIISKFKRTRPDVLSGAAELARIGEAKQWSPCCEYLHHGSVDDEAPEFSDETKNRWLRPWERARSLFHQVIQCLPAGAFTRDILDPDLVIRFQRLRDMLADSGVGHVARTEDTERRGEQR